MRILVTNDDGINAPGLTVLETIAAQIAGPDGDVWVVAPANEQSGVGHCISYTHPTLLSQVGPQRFTTDGSPADCVMAGLHEVMKDAPPDLILSGVNRGNNAGENTVYSGTLGAAMEGALQGVRSIALSQFFGPESPKGDRMFDVAAHHGAEVVQSLIDHGVWGDSGYRVFYNVNFPPCAMGDVKGQRITTQGWREGTVHRVEAQKSPTGREFLWVTGGPQRVETGPGTDVAANMEGYISITPCRADLTAHDLVEDLKAKLDR